MPYYSLFLFLLQQDTEEYQQDGVLILKRFFPNISRFITIRVTIEGDSTRLKDVTYAKKSYNCYLHGRAWIIIGFCNRMNFLIIAFTDSIFALPE